MEIMFKIWVMAPLQLKMKKTKVLINFKIQVMLRLQQILEIIPRMLKKN